MFLNLSLLPRVHLHTPPSPARTTASAKILPTEREKKDKNKKKLNSPFTAPLPSFTPLTEVRETREKEN
jgi:hypothetical protein